MDLEIRKNLTIPSSELTYVTSRSSGPGGQHANKSETRVTLKWDLENTELLGPIQKSRVRKKLSTYLTDEGIIKLSSDANRSQKRNKSDVQERFCRLLLAALKVPKRRKKTKPSRRAKERRLKNKKKKSDKKKNRNFKDW